MRAHEIFSKQHSSTVSHYWDYWDSTICTGMRLTFNLRNFTNFLNWKINKFSEFFQFGKPSKFQKLANFGIVCPFDIPHYSQFCRFLYLPFDINEFRRFIFSIFIFYCGDHKFGRSIFERSLIFKFKM